MGRIEKIKRELIEEANKRMLGEQEEPINQKDEQGRHQGLWVHEWNGKRREVYYKDGKWHGSLKQWHPNGKLSMEGEAKDGTQIGIWKFYYDNGKLKRETTYTSGSGTSYSWVDTSKCWNESGIEIVCGSLRYNDTEILKKPYTFTDGKGNKYQGVVDGIGDDYTLEVTIDGMEDLSCSSDSVLELYKDKKGKKWVMNPVDCDKKTQKEFLKFTNGGLIQDELLSLAPWK